MYRFGKTSQKRLNTCHPDIIKIVNEAIKYIDFTVLEGHRTKELQDRYYQTGTSKKKWPNSKHNSYPSNAIDICPYPVKWPQYKGNMNHKEAVQFAKDYGRFYYMQGIIKGIAQGLGINIRWGGDWDMDGDILDQNFDDLPHFELIAESV